jgi:voltage-gated potassium channel
MQEEPARSETQSLRHRLYVVVFEADTPAGKAFDVALLVVILVSIVAVMLESVDSIRTEHGAILRWIEWTITILFTIEYVLRLWLVRRPVHYAWSFFGVVDLLSILPTYVSVLVPGAQSFLVIRAVRLLRVFRILKLAHFLGEANLLGRAMRASSRKIIVFLVTVVTLVLIIGALMYLIEGPQSGFTSIPMSMYWAIVTMTTVGYGDIAPQTVLGQLLASAVMIVGYGIIAVPTGIVTVEMAEAYRQGARERQACAGCGLNEHDTDARFCKRCGNALTGR